MDIEDINVIAVLGAGNMGHGITEVAALSGYEVTMRDIDENLVQDGYEQIEWSLDKLVENGRIADGEATAARERISPVVDLETGVENADVVIEAVPETVEIKRNVWEDVSEYAPEEAIFATNTSSLSITDLAAFTDRPERFCGMHFFNPPVRMDLVEVITGDETDEAVVETVAALAESMDKTPVRVHEDEPGFIVNRILVPLMNEAAWLVHEEAATVEAVDSTTKFDIGLPMGSFELADQVGIDVGYHVLEYMHEELGPAYEPCPLLETKVEAEELGKKTGRGIYDYEDGPGAEIPTDAGSELVRDRLLATMANEAAKLIGGDVATPDAIDEATQLGAGFPDGPVAMADDYGLENALGTLEDAAEETGHERYEPADYLRERAEAGGFRTERESDRKNEGAAVDFETLRIEYPGDMVGHVVLDRPHRMNTISTTLLEELPEAVDRLEDDEEVRAILVTGAGDRAFSAGADVQSMAAGGADPLEGVELSRTGQRALGTLESADLPVVAGIDGYCLGGGMELATCADLRIASDRSEFGQPELELGLVPGWGGTQRLKHVVGEGRAKEIILTADRYDAETMAEYGFVNEVVESGELEAAALELARELAAGPPLAHRFTKRAMRAGRDDTDAGLELEATAFGHLMATDDLMEGITAFMGDGEPNFQGE
ncbi:3-hydroxyacyl-CoA dehydrogenase/enoyl-CoA hydratase family protein [Natrialbaceae archaeon AArc-T1-2]|uniref:3-hydroxyacyl-CoA dehydrogenase/enoyl-CoA hydratase family protein n=1 Tax=Natrialbaceae archaeon AArc-T1-2 TaxID=3053904 RepID=UPI00255A7E3A|nr:3-hydroxyacyl-CoA dehydrogenase/enoyl-CoA hydratase family protein [Natrialbaceae archaeon AArc-T1-2]WIV67235.1 3-hydroxyacyl-CoA dehydrogenase NAD-binding domain-containing protein [Natrialbaceae archaeon AArc-T1-2]